MQSSPSSSIDYPWCHQLLTYPCKPATSGLIDDPGCRDAKQQAERLREQLHAAETYAQKLRQENAELRARLGDQQLPSEPQPSAPSVSASHGMHLIPEQDTAVCNERTGPVVSCFLSPMSHVSQYPVSSHKCAYEIHQHRQTGACMLSVCHLSTDCLSLTKASAWSSPKLSFLNVRQLIQKVMLCCLDMLPRCYSSKCHPMHSNALKASDWRLAAGTAADGDDQPSGLEASIASDQQQLPQHLHTQSSSA